ncbi:hypothetical protein TRIATDRAFT_299457, partial [Trichoderma atroviride IMI 206040]
MGPRHPQCNQSFTTPRVAFGGTAGGAMSARWPIERTKTPHACRWLVIGEISEKRKKRKKEKKRIKSHRLVHF